MGAPSNENLSLGKLRRAVDGNNSYTDISKLGEVCAGTTSANANVSMSDFYISAVAAPTGYAFVDEQTAETYTLQFSDTGARFLARIGAQSFNFSWSGSALFPPGSSQDYTAVYTAGSISNVDTANTEGDGTRGTFHAAHTNDTAAVVGGTFAEDGQSDGYNDHATNYNSKLTKSVQIEDTYNSSAITCFLPDTPIELADGEKLPIEDLVVGDKIKSFDLEGLPDESLGIDRYRNFSLDTTIGEHIETEVKNVWFDFNTGYLNINNGLLKVTSEHEFWCLNNTTDNDANPYMPVIGKWGFKKAVQLKAGDKLFSQNGIIEVESIEWNHLEVEVVNINVEPVDVYFVNGILAHNKGNNSQH